jgi:hypothetical protein
MAVPTKAIAGVWGPIAMSVTPVRNIEHLRVAADDLRDLADALSHAADEKSAQWKRSTDRAMRESLWLEYEELWREYRVTRAWHDATQAAYVFAECGFQTPYLEGITEIDVDALAQSDRADH